jgi:hypothetical protein
LCSEYAIDPQSPLKNIHTAYGQFLSVYCGMFYPIFPALEKVPQVSICQETFALNFSGIAQSALDISHKI